MMPDRTTLEPGGAGENELVFAASEFFGGWGLLYRIPDRTGLQVP